MQDLEDLDDVRSLQTRHLELLESILSLDRALAGLSQGRPTPSILATVNAHLKQALGLQSVAFFLVNADDLTYQLAFVDPPEEEPAVRRETNRAIEEGVFGWALKRNQALVQMVEDSRQFVLHPLITAHSTVGMLAAFAPPSFEASSSSLTFLSVILSKVALSLENRMLHGDLEEYNRQLERVVAQLRASEDRLTTILERMPVGVAMIDREGTISWLNESLKNMVAAANKEELVSHKCAEVICASGGACVPGLQVERERKLCRRDGKECTVLLSALPIEVGGVARWLCIFFDVTRRKSLESELNRARKLEAVGQLAAGIAHEINTPAQYVGDSIRFLSSTSGDMLNLIAKYRDVIARLAPSAEVVQEVQAAEEGADLEYAEQETPAAFERVREGITRISAIVSAMKDFAHPDLREKSHADLNHALGTTLVIARNEYKHVADVTTEFGDIPTVLCHVGDIKQVFLNLLVNAAHAVADVVKGSQTRGSIIVRTRQEGDCVRVEISDSGCGIPKAIRERIYDPFFTTKEVGRGSGQGLAIAWSIIVDKHGGSLSFDSEVGKGTTFKILLPIEGSLGTDRQDSGP